jgi:toxin YoeB
VKRRVIFESDAFEDFTEWAQVDKKLYKKIVELLKDIDRSPFTGLGKPEPLKHDLSGFWSRRINDEHRLVYTVTDEEMIIIGCKYHYVN